MQVINLWLNNPTFLRQIKQVIFCVTAEVLEKCQNAREISHYIKKKKFDDKSLHHEKMMVTWFCIVGQSYGCFVTLEKRKFMYYLRKERSVFAV